MNFLSIYRRADHFLRTISSGTHFQSDPKGVKIVGVDVEQFFDLANEKGEENAESLKKSKSLD